MVANGSQSTIIKSYNGFEAGRYVGPITGRTNTKAEKTSVLLELPLPRYYRKPGFLYSTRSPMRSLVFIAMKHIRDEELLLNYRLHPDSQLPTWYTSVDTEEDRRRWKY